jgi:hypothetical protein
VPTICTDVLCVPGLAEVVGDGHGDNPEPSDRVGVIGCSRGHSVAALCEPTSANYMLIALAIWLSRSLLARHPHPL